MITGRGVSAPDGGVAVPVSVRVDVSANSGRPPWIRSTHASEHPATSPNLYGPLRAGPDGPTVDARSAPGPEPCATLATMVDTAGGTDPVTADPVTADPVTVGEGDTADLAFVCPRCGADVRERFYGPCSACRDELRATLGGTAREVEATEYEPKMNVTPNAVALRDD